MKVLQINSFFSVGGPPHIMNGIYDTLVANGHECMIASAREKMYAPENSIRIGTKTSVKVNALKARLLDNEGFNAKKATLKLIQWIKEYNPDVIHLHNLHGYYINIELLFDDLKEANIPVVWTLHDCWAFTGHSAYCDAIHCKRWKRECFDCPQKREYPKSILNDNSSSNWKKKRKAFLGVKNLTIVTPSQWLADLVKESFLNKYPIKVIHNGIDLTEFHPCSNNFRERYNLRNRFIILGVASVWNKFKGLEDYKQLSNILDKRFKIVLVGLNDRQIREMPDKILCLPRTKSVKELTYIYSSADVFLNLTYCDTFPTVNIEALSCGIPIITYETGGSTEVINSNNGMIVKQGDLKGILTALEYFRNTKWDKVAIEESALLYDRRTMLDNYLKIYNSRELNVDLVAQSVRGCGRLDCSSIINSCRFGSRGG